jgi:hypothetical protein
MFSLFAGVCFAVKSKSTVKCLLLTGKTLSKIWKTVYGICKPFSKILQPLTPPPLPALSLSFLHSSISPPPRRSRVTVPLAPISNSRQPSADLAQQTTPRDLLHRKPIEARVDLGFSFFFFLPDLVMGYW